MFTKMIADSFPGRSPASPTWTALWRVAVVAAVALVPAGPADAQNIPSPYRFVDHRQEAGFFTGFHSMGEGQFDMGPGPGPFIGGRYAVGLGGPIFLEGVITLAPTTRDVINPGAEEGARVIGEADALMTSVDARFRFNLTGTRTWNDLAPFLVAGGGFVFDLESEQAPDFELAPDDRFEFGTSFLGRLGMGSVWIPGNGRLELRGEAALQFWQLETPQGFRTLDRFPDAPPDEWVSGLSLSIGAAYLF